MKTVTLNVEGISQGQWSTFLLELNLMKKAWKPYGVDVKLKAHSINKIIEKGTTIHEYTRYLWYKKIKELAHGSGYYNLKGRTVPFDPNSREHNN